MTFIEGFIRRLYPERTFVFDRTSSEQLVVHSPGIPYFTIDTPPPLRGRYERRAWAEGYLSEVARVVGMHMEDGPAPPGLVAPEESLSIPPQTAQ